MKKVTCVVLAAGRSSRFPGNKLLAPLAGGTLLERTLRACAGFPTVAVCSPEIAPCARAANVTVLVNSEPDRGMAHSLRLADERIDRGDAIAVLPADLAFIAPEHVAEVIEASRGFDVTYPVRADGTPGHPVVFSPHAREGIASLADGRPIREIRDRADLTRRTLEIQAPWPYRDVDRKSDLEAL